MTRNDDHYAKIARMAAAGGPKSGGAEGGNAQFDFLQETDTDGLETYDEGEAFDKKGATVADRDTDEYENGLPAPREGLSSQKEKLPMNGPSELDLKKARVASKIAAMLLPHANGEAIENQAAIFAKYLPPKALAATLERVWYDREGGKLAAQRVAAKKQKLAADEEALDQADSMMGDEDMDAMATDDMDADDMGGDMDAEMGDDGMEAFADDELAEIDDDDMGDLADDMADDEMGDDMGDDMMGDDMAEEAMANYANQRLDSRGKTAAPSRINRQASQSAASGKQRAKQDVQGGKPGKSPRIEHPRRPRTAAQKPADEVSKLAEVMGKHLGAPTADTIKTVRDMFAV